VRAKATESLIVRYWLRAADAAAARERATALAREQTVELPAGIVPARREAATVGRRLGAVERLEEAGWKGAWSVRIAFPLEAVAATDPEGGPGLDLPQLLNVLFGNVSLWDGVRVAGVEWPSSLLAGFPGPTHGVAGLRTLCGVPRRPLLCAALKPLGLGARELAELAARAAEAGVDLVKDDHGLADQRPAPFGERVRRCHDAVREAAAKHGTRTLYLPNLSGPVDRLAERLALLRELGVHAVMVAPALLGLDVVRSLVQGSAAGLAVVGHPSFSGAWMAAGHGLASEVVWGELFRLVGCDAVIYPNAGGRFPITAAAVASVHQRLRAPLGAVAPALPLLGGGIQPDTVAAWAAHFGPDTGFLVGGAIYRGADPVGTARRMLDSLARWE
jgi:ribulose-bisphosphate carboxylase large chain